MFSRFDTELPDFSSTLKKWKKKKSLFPDHSNPVEGEVSREILTFYAENGATPPPLSYKIIPENQEKEINWIIERNKVVHFGFLETQELKNSWPKFFEVAVHLNPAHLWPETINSL